ncbi:MAG: septum formation initiator family protein [Flavobacteriales bacterium]|nr:septum formation initiator family protein [Flavobacteriales bacterium]
MKKLLERIPPRLRNRYWATAFGLLCWIAFFDRNDAWTTFKNRRELGRMHDDKETLTREIAKTKEDIHELSSDKSLLEKFAREEYYMKRDNEDIFVLVPEKR